MSDRTTNRSSEDCESFLRQVVGRIEPGGAQRDAASRSHTYLRTILASGQMTSVITDSYLSGSYARDTAISPLDDVDIIFVIEPQHWQNAVQSFLRCRPSPTEVLTTFARAIRYRYRESSVFMQRRSVCLELYHLNIDVVPALRSGKDSSGILVGDATNDQWIESAPKRHEALATEVNKARAGLFKPLVKLLKFWNSNLPATARMKSFVIETMAVRIFESLSFESLQDGLVKFFDFMGHLNGKPTLYKWSNSCGMSFSWFTGSVVPDSAGTGSNLLANVENIRLQRYNEHAIRSRDRLQASMETADAEAVRRKAAEALRM